uniref:Uncharacterized protein n=1 Tax=Amphimedon queenslandica TaxID=400682 RepID=A0A1X7VGD2_AMPQE
MDGEQFNELDRLIKITEFENKVQDKAIYNEREMIAAYEKEINQLNKDIERMEKEMARNDELSLKYLRKIGQSKENYESLKKTSVVLDDHLEALGKKAAEAKQEAAERREKMRHAIEYYTLKWEEYKKKYESTKLGKAYVAVCKEVKDLEKELEELDKELEEARKALRKKNPIEKIKPWIIEFAELGLMAEQSSAEVKELDIINESLSSKIDQMKLEIDDATAKIQEASTKSSNNASNLIHPPPSPFVGPGDGQISTSKRPRIDPTITTSWASKLKTFAGGPSVHVNNPRPSSTGNNPGSKPDSGPPGPRPLANVLKPVSTFSNPLTAKLTTVSRPSVNIGSPLMTRPIMCPRPPSIQNPLSVSKPPSIETPPMTSRPLTLEIPLVVSNSNPIIANPSSIANNPSLLSRPLAVNTPLSRPSTMEIPVSRPLGVELPVSRPRRVELPVSRPLGVDNTVSRPLGVDNTVSRPLGVDNTVSRPLVSSSEIEPEMSMETLEPIGSMEIPQGQESGLNFYYGEMQQEGLPQEGEEEGLREDDYNVGGLGGLGGGGFMSDLFNEAAANTVPSCELFSSISGGNYSQSVGINETAGNFPDVFSSATGGQSGNQGGGVSGGGAGGMFSFFDAKTTDTGMFSFFGGDNTTNNSGW